MSLRDGLMKLSTDKLNVIQSVFQMRVVTVRLRAMNPSFLAFLPRLRTLIWGGAALTLLTLAMVMRLTGQGDWTAFDYVVAASLLAAVCAGLELAMRLSTIWTYRLAAIMSVGGGFLMVWANLAVGIIGNEENPQNLIFYGVLLIGLAGALYTRFDPQGLKWTLRTMAAAQLAVFLIALSLGWALLPVFTVFYFSLWLIAGELFSKSATASS